MPGNCLFCRILRGEIPSTKVYEDEDYYAFRDIHPAAPIHVLVIPKEHIAQISDADAGHRLLLGGLLLAANKVAAQEGLTADGFRLVINNGVHGGQTVYHVHLHVLGNRPMSWPPG